jgi:hypothetical protein
MLFQIAAVVAVLLVLALVAGNRAIANATPAPPDRALVDRFEGCAVLEVRTGRYPVVALLPTRVVDKWGEVLEGAELSMVHQAISGEGHDGLVAVLRAAEETGSRVDVVVTVHSDDVARQVVRTVAVSVTGGDGGRVELIDAAPYHEVA